MNRKTKILAVLVTVIGLTAMTAEATLACSGFREGFRRGVIFGRGGMGMGSSGLVPFEMRQEFRADFREMSEEERQQLRQARRDFREGQRAAIEEFVGLSREEISQARRDGQKMGEILADNGKTSDDAAEFLTERADDRVDHLVTWHELDTAEEQTLRDRIADFVQRILGRWFGDD
ncbi:hypothetical protein AMJ57_03985 [Parcubacteria bacterium SG8_24]|nr:MAG: hypothetical protein AMJ57_03985 [Parcubacteria bacterium SG8_24]